MIWGILLSAFGLGGTFGFWNYIVNDIRYSYRSPFTSHELTILCLLFLSVAMLLAGILVIIFAVIRKNNQDRLQRVERMGPGNQMAGVCPQCGLNITSGTEICPRCGYSMIKSEEEL